MMPYLVANFFISGNKLTNFIKSASVKKMSKRMHREGFKRSVVHSKNFSLNNFVLPLKKFGY